MLVYRTAVKYRLLRRKTPRNDVGGRSFCDYCGKQLSCWDNIPVVSWLGLRGKSRCCGKKLPGQYPLVELGMGIIFVITNYQLLITNSGQLILILATVTLLVFSAVFDWKYMILPDFSTLILIIMALLGVIFDEKNIIPYLLSAIGASGLLLGLHVITKGKGMGFGDVKLAIFMGLLLGWPKVMVAFYVAFIVGAGVSVLLMMLKKVKLRSAIPFGPFLILGTVLAWWWGDEIIKLLITNY